MVRFQTIGAVCALTLALASGSVQAQTLFSGYKDNLTPDPSQDEILSNLDTMLGSMLPGMDDTDQPFTLESETPPSPDPSKESELEDLLQAVLQELEEIKQEAGSTPNEAENQAPEDDKFIKAANAAAEKLNAEVRAEKEAKEAARTAALAKSTANRNAEALAGWRRVYMAQFPAYAGSPNWALVPPALNAHYIGSSIATMPDGQISTGDFEVVFDFTTLYAYGGMTFTPMAG